MKKGSDIRTYIFILSAVLLSKLLGLIRDTMLANYYGTGFEAAAFSTASRIPLLFFDITLGTAVAAAFIPVFNSYLGKEQKDRAFEFANIFASCVAIFATVISLLLLLFPNVAVYIMAPGFDPATANLAGELIRIMSPVVLIAVLSYTFVGVLQSLGEFNRPAIMSAISNLAVIGYYIFLNDDFGITGLAIAVVGGWVLQLLILIRPMMKFGLKFRFVPSFSDPGLKNVAILALPVLISSWVQPINTVISNNISSYINGGRAVTVINFAYQLYFMVAGIFALSLTNLFFPRMSRMFARGENEQGGELLYNLLSTITLIVLPVIGFFTLFASQIVGVVYQRGLFTQTDTTTVAAALSIYSIGMLGLSWQEILNKYFYSQHDSKTPMFVAIAGIAVNIGAAIYLSKIYGVSGIAAGVTISVCFMAVLLFVMSVIKTGFSHNKKLFSDMVKGILSLSAACAAMLTLARFVPFSAFHGFVMSLVWLGLIFTLGIIIYVLLIVASNAGAVRSALHIFKKGDGKV